MTNSFWRLVAVCFCLAGCATLPPADTSVRPPTYPADTVVVYVRTGCPYCEQTLDLLAMHQIAPIVRNVTQDRSAYQELLAIYRDQFPGDGVIVPVIGKGGTYLRGYNRLALEGLLSDLQVTDSGDFEFCE